MPPLASKRRKASPSPLPSEASSDSGSDSDLHLHDHSDPEDDGFFSARSAAVDSEDEQDSNEEEEEEEEEEDDGEMGELEQEYRTLQANQQYVFSPFHLPSTCRTFTRLIHLRIFLPPAEPFSRH